MITPTRTVCYAIPEGTDKLFVVKEIFSDSALLELPLHYIQLYSFSEIGRFIVREEPLKKGEGPKYHWCNKNFNPMHPCYCGNCDSVLSSYSFMRPIPMPQYTFQKMYQGEWRDEK